MNATNSEQHNHGLGWWKAACCAVIVAGLAWLLFHEVKDARDAAIASSSQGPLNQLSLALYNYHDVYGCLPPAYITDKQGKPIHSWRALILPYVDARGLYEEYRFDEPWDGPNNIKLTNRMPPIFHCPSEPESTSLANYVAIVGPDTAFPGPKSTSFADFQDGTDHTILLAEIADSSTKWLEPRDLNVDEMSFTANDALRPSISSARRSGPYVVFAGGISAYCVSESLNPQTLKALTTIDRGEPIVMADIDGLGLTTLAIGSQADTMLRQVKQSNSIESFNALWLNRSAVSDMGIAHLEGATKPYKLHLAGTQVIDDGLKHLGARTYYYTLDLAGTDVSDAGLAHLKGLTKTYYIHLQKTKVTLPGVVKLIQSLPKTTIEISQGRLGQDHLSAQGSSITDADLKHFAVLNLVSVDLSQTNITGEGLKHFGRMKTLSNLDLSNTDLTVQHLKYVRNLSGLQSLVLSGTGLTDNSFETLQELTSLQYLDLGGTTISESVVNDLENSLTNCTIRR